MFYQIPKKKRRIGERGAIMMMVMVLLICFVIIMAVLVQLIARQSHVTSDKTQENHSFGLADAGVRYVLWLLNSGQYTPGDLVNNPPGSFVHNIVEGSEGKQGFFMVDVLSDSAVSPDGLKVRSIGFNYNMLEACQGVEADIASDGSGSYIAVRWNHEPGFDCRDLIERGTVHYPVSIPSGLGEKKEMRVVLSSPGETGPERKDGYVFTALAPSQGKKLVVEAEPVTSGLELQVRIKPFQANIVAYAGSLLRAAATLANGAIPNPSLSKTCAGLPVGSACSPAGRNGWLLRNGIYTVKVEPEAGKPLPCSSAGSECEYNIRFYYK